VFGGPFATYAGGKGANQAVAIAHPLMAGLSDAGVDTEHIYLHPTALSGCAAVVVDSNGMNQIIVAPGANMEMTAHQVRSALKGVSNAFVLAQLETTDDVVHAAGEGQRLCFNPAPARNVDDSMFGCFLVSPNEAEARYFTGIEPESDEACRRIARQLLELGSQNVVITLGERGCYWKSADQELYVPAPAVHAVDSVGAGDAFNGALAYFLSLGRDWPNALALANHVGALSVTKRGAQTSMPTLEELRSFAGALY